MKILTPGHLYEVANFENPETFQTLQFIEKVPKVQGGTEMHTENDGTTNEELLAVLIDRIRFLNTKFPCRENSCCITHLEEGLHWLNARTAERLARAVEGKHIA